MKKFAPLSFVDAGPATCIRENAYLGKGWYHRPLVKYMLDCGFIQKHHIVLSWFPTRELPQDTFREPIAKISGAIQELAKDGDDCQKHFWAIFEKQLFNSAIGFMVSVDECTSFEYGCSTDPSEKPSCARLLPSQGALYQ